MLLCSSPAIRQKIAKTAAVEWMAVERALRPMAEDRGFLSRALDEDMKLTIVDESDEVGNRTWSISDTRLPMLPVDDTHTQ